MKPVKTIVISTVMILTFCFAALISRSSAPKPHHFNMRGDGFAVLELFTSEGCSSCPPADELMARIAQESAGAPVYILAYHVDYWNRLGWKDAFSKPEFSKRQYQYSRQLNAQVYTPQLIINGKAEFVGSDAPAIRSAIQAALAKPARATLGLKAVQQNGEISVSCQAEGRVHKGQLLLAIVQKQAVSKVGGGENGGRTLRHVQIVRKLYHFEDLPAGESVRKIPVPAGFNSHDWEVIGFVQDALTGEINGATRVVIGSSLAEPASIN